MFALFSTLIFVQSVVQHEYLHQRIFKSYGIDSNVTYNFIGAFKQQMFHPFNFNIQNNEAWAWTTPNYTMGNCTETCRALNLELEISDSQTDNIIITLLVVFFLYISHFTVTHQKEKENNYLIYDHKQE